MKLLPHLSPLSYCLIINTSFSMGRDGGVERADILI
jgi:hypothetical protein